MLVKQYFENFNTLLFKQYVESRLQQLKLDFYINSKEEMAHEQQKSQALAKKRARQAEAAGDVTNISKAMTTLAAMVQKGGDEEMQAKYARVAIKTIAVAQNVASVEFTIDMEGVPDIVLPRTKIYSHGELALTQQPEYAKTSFYITAKMQPDRVVFPPT